MVSLGGAPGRAGELVQSKESALSTHFKSNPETHAIFNRLWNPKWSQNRPKINQKSMKNRSQMQVCFRLCFLIDF